MEKPIELLLVSLGNDLCEVKDRWKKGGKKPVWVVFVSSKNNQLSSAGLYLLKQEKVKSDYFYCLIKRKIDETCPSGDIYFRFKANEIQRTPPNPRDTLEEIKPTWVDANDKLLYIRVSYAEDFSKSVLDYVTIANKKITPSHLRRPLPVVEKTEYEEGGK